LREGECELYIAILTVHRFLIQDMTKADLQAQDKEFEEYLQENGWEGDME